MKRGYLLIIIFLFFTTVNAQVFYEGFDGDVFPPEGWVLETTNTTNTWEVFTFGGFDDTPKAAQVWYDLSENQDESLITPSIDLSTCSSPKLVFGSATNYEYSVSPHDNIDLACLISVDGGGTWIKIWDENELVEVLGGPFQFQPYVITEDLSAFVGNSDVKLKFQYVGVDGAQWIIDEIKIVENVGIDGIIKSEDDFFIYPNPIKDVINISLSENFNIEDITVTITNTSGKEVAKFNDITKLNASNLASGIYFISITDGVIAKTKKLFKE